MKTILFISTFLYAITLTGQSENLLNNGSFEQDGKALLSKVPMGWINYGFVRHSPPDVHSSSSNFFEVVKRAAHGEHFVGMVTRSNETWEVMGQELETPLEKGQEYIFTVALARSPLYVSIDVNTRKDANFTVPVILRVYGMINKEQILLAETNVIDHEQWKKYQMTFKADFAYEQFLLEAYYDDERQDYYNGNLLIDDCVLLKIE